MTSAGQHPLELDALRDELIEISKKASTASRDDDVAALYALADTLRRRADAAEGERLALLEVALAFVERMARNDVSREALILHSIVGGDSDAGRELLEKLGRGESVEWHSVDRLDDNTRAKFLELVQRGVLQRSAARARAAASWRATVLDHVVPLPLRTWGTVERARKLALVERDRDAAAKIVAGVVGITMGQAEAFLAVHGSRASAGAPRYQRGGVSFRGEAPTARVTTTPAIEKPIDADDTTSPRNSLEPPKPLH